MVERLPYGSDRYRRTNIRDKERYFKISLGVQFLMNQRGKDDAQHHGQRHCANRKQHIVF
ncbi:hypothetical protein D3C73_1663280 [compost metagenome]